MGVQKRISNKWRTITKDVTCIIGGEKETEEMTEIKMAESVLKLMADTTTDPESSEKIE